MPVVFFHLGNVLEKGLPNMDGMSIVYINLKLKKPSPNTTLPETNIAPTNGWLEYYFPIGDAYFQGLR